LEDPLEVEELLGKGAGASNPVEEDKALFKTALEDRGSTGFHNSVNRQAGKALPQ